MRTQEEIKAKVAQIQLDIDKGKGRKDLNQIMIDILLGDKEEEDFDDNEDSWKCSAANDAAQWLQGYESGI